MPTDAWAQGLARYAKHWWPEALLAVLVLAGFLGCLGSVELWGKREQRAAAEAIDTVDHNHWLVAEIQGRPRLEKPPLPRWSIAVLMKLTGRRDEWIVRLPGALAGVLTVALIYALGRRAGDRELGLASAFVLCSMGFFVGEMRQASNDRLLALFTTLALYAAWRIARSARGEPSSIPTCWGTGLLRRARPGVLDQGPDHPLAGGRDACTLPGVSAAACVGTAQACLGGWGLLIFVAVALCWPVAVLLQDPSGSAGLVAGDVGKDRSLAHSGASPAPAAGRSVARHGASLDVDRRAGGGAAILA